MTNPILSVFFGAGMGAAGGDERPWDLLASGCSGRSKWSADPHVGLEGESRGVLHDAHGPVQLILIYLRNPSAILGAKLTNQPPLAQSIQFS
jgi:hypothetical protein